MKYLLELESNGLSLAIPVEKQVIEERDEVELLVERALFQTLRKMELDEEEEQEVLDEWIQNLNNVGFWMPRGCNLDEILFNLREANVFNLLTANTSFPLTLEETLTEEEADSFSEWKELTGGLTQMEGDWM